MWVACARVECVSVCRCYSFCSDHHLWRLFIFLCFKQLSHIIHFTYWTNGRIAFSYDVVRQKYMLIWWMCIDSEHCVFRIHTRLWFVDEKKEEEEEGARVSETLKFFGKSDRSLCAFFARHEHVFAVNSSLFGVVLNFLAFPLPHIRPEPFLLFFYAVRPLLTHFRIPISTKAGSYLVCLACCYGRIMYFFSWIQQYALFYYSLLLSMCTMYIVHHIVFIVCES